MNWRNLFTRSRPQQAETKNLAAPDEALLALFGVTPAASGISVTPVTAMRCTPVRAAVLLIAETLASLPLHAYRRGAGDARERDPSHPADRLLSQQANEWTSAPSLKTQLVIDALLHDHGGFALIVRTGDGRPVELHRLEPHSVRVECDGVSPPLYYVRDGNNAPERSYGFRDVIHIHAGCRSPISDAREAIGVALSLERHASTLFGEHSGRPAGVLQTDESLVGSQQGATALQRIKEGWLASFGNGRSGSIAVLDRGLKFQPLTFSSTDSQFLEHRRFANEEICRAFKVPPTLIGALESATWANMEQTRQLFLDVCLNPWLLRFEAEFNSKLIDDPNVFVEFNRAAVVQMALTERYAAYSTAITARFLSPNDVRRLENMPPYEGGDTYENPATSRGAVSGDQTNNPDKTNNGDN